MHWQRPADVPLGVVWERFQGRERDGVPAKMYQIRDLDPEYTEQCLDMMQETFLRDEPLCHVLGIPKDQESIVTIRNNWRKYVSQNICVTCFTEENGEPKELVGFNVLYVRCRDDEEEDIEKMKGEQWRKLLKTLIAAEQLVDVFEYYGVDKFLTSSGLTVVPGHRGQNIGARIIGVRKQLCKAFKLKAVSTVFTAITSQVLAAKCGYQTLATLPYSDMAKVGVDLTVCETQSAKVMAIHYDCDEKNNNI